MNNTFSFTLESPLTAEQINLITDAEFEHTDRIWFDTPKGKHVEFVKAQKWIPCEERLPEKREKVLKKDDDLEYDIGYWDYRSIYSEDIYGREYDTGADIVAWYGLYFWHKQYNVIAWMPLPEPYKESEN